MKNYYNDDAYSRAKYKVERIKRFYKHLAAYIIVNSLILGIKIIRNLTHGESFSEAIFDINFYGIWLFWGIGLAFHAFAVFGVDHFLGKNWEENKIKQFMEEDNHKVNSKN
ncbi:MAG: 2TM domain-containing protein [Bacteroidetes bacterium]|nr:2TM domain-containing protein [Bacteroidota bacterium]